jgi:predicted exporter
MAAHGLPGTSARIVTALRAARGKQSAVWLLLAFAAVAVLVFKLELSFDISAFLPNDAGLGHEVLVEQLRNGPGSRVLLIGLGGGDRERLSDASDALRRSLAGQAAFSSVSNGEFEDSAAVPPPVADYFLLQREVDYSEAGLRAVLDERLQDLAFGGGSRLLELIARDPYLVTLDILERLVPVTRTGELWFSADGSAVLVAETRAAPTDIAAQEQALTAIRSAFDELPGSDSLRLDVTGVGAFSVELQNIIRAEATKRSLYASFALLLVLLLVFRRPRLLLLAAVPIGMGFLTGLASIALLFD